MADPTTLVGTVGTAAGWDATGVDGYAGVDVPSLMSVLDEHMSALRAVYPAEHQAVMSRVRLLHDAHQAQD